MMKILLFVILTLAAFSCNKAEADKPVDAKSIVVIFDNDVHCSIDAYPQMAGLRDAIAAADTSYVFTVSCGDYAQGGMAGLFSSGEYPIDIINSVGYDAVAVGNHEFDYKAARFRELMSIIKAPVVCANLTDPQGRPLFDRFVIRQCGSRKIAFIGALTPAVEVAESYSIFDEDGHRIFDLNEDKLAAMVQDAVNAARAAGADYVVLLSHLGEKDWSTTSRDVIKATEGIDVLLDGHTHSTFAQDTCYNRNGQPVITAETGTGLVNVGKLVISPAGKITTELIPAAEIAFTSGKVQKTVDSVKVQYGAIAGKMIGTCEKTLTIYDDSGKRIVRNRECTMGNFVADAYLAVADAQIAVANGGSVRANLNAGDVSYQDIINVQPFGNTLCSVRCTGRGIIAMIEKCAESVPEENGAFSQVAGIRYTIDTKAGNKVVDVDLLDSKTGEYAPLNPDAEYILAATSYTVDLLKTELGTYEYINPVLMTDYEACIKYVSDILGGKIGHEFAALKGRITIK